MILSGLKIVEEAKKGNIVLEPFDVGMVNPNSYNYHLGDELLEVVDEIIDPKKETNVRKILLTEEGYVLQPNRLYLGSTVEKIGSSQYVTQLIGRSSTGRMGLFLQVTAPLGHVGCQHCWTLELRVVQPLRIYPNMRVGQVTFWKLYGDKTSTYEVGKYNFYTKPHVSFFYEKGLFK